MHFGSFDLNRPLTPRDRRARRVVEGFFQTGLEFVEQGAHGLGALSANLNLRAMTANSFLSFVDKSDA
jgi:hypothetical protein